VRNGQNGATGAMGTTGVSGVLAGTPPDVGKTPSGQAVGPLLGYLPATARCPRRGRVGRVALKIAWALVDVRSSQDQQSRRES